MSRHIAKGSLVCEHSASAPMDLNSFMDGVPIGRPGCHRGERHEFGLIAAAVGQSIVLMLRSCSSDLRLLYQHGTQKSPYLDGLAVFLFRKTAWQLWPETNKRVCHTPICRAADMFQNPDYQG
ncbi:hypothetical protein BRADI_2g12423v3 [Brachypodium distachyon]|uniref:Uncharacterized protein n=1 Tax=Brachypodium distachyon TaxID=15368 RepID=A0A2K2D856_BRADI|nr:hypothetical protein BRADI_2g12423v3 [Brachypodium distachyon]